MLCALYKIDTLYGRPQNLRHYISIQIYTVETLTAKCVFKNSFSYVCEMCAYYNVNVMLLLSYCLYLFYSFSACTKSNALLLAWWSLFAF